ncbi:MAG TPA: hypothetical protein VKD26_03795 [Streptosporangiaceae bacterium]|nr:hypothetical protein [Streptosporangiaceae bacterium]
MHHGALLVLEELDVALPNEIIGPLSSLRGRRPNGTRLASARRSTATAPGRRAVRTGEQAQRYRQRQDIVARRRGLDARRLAAVRQAPAAHGGTEAGGVTSAEGLRDDQG